MPGFSEVGFTATAGPTTAFPSLNSSFGLSAASWGFTIKEFFLGQLLPYRTCCLRVLPCRARLARTKGVSHAPPSALPLAGHFQALPRHLLTTFSCWTTTGGKKPEQPGPRHHAPPPEGTCGSQGSFPGLGFQHVIRVRPQVHWQECSETSDKFPWANSKSRFHARKTVSC